MTIIAIDGTFSSGKGTLGKALAAHYDLPYLDTGKLYRAVAKAVLNHHKYNDPENDMHAMEATFDLDLSNLDAPELKSANVAVAASKVAIHPSVRGQLLGMQRDFAAKGGILDGRDIGTVICPDADVKLYVTASAEERAARRHKELQGYGEDISYETILAQLHERDNRDMNRSTAPLRPADDAHLLDTSALDIDAAFEAARRICDAVFAAKSLSI